MVRRLIFVGVFAILAGCDPAEDPVVPTPTPAPKPTTPSEHSAATPSEAYVGVEQPSAAAAAGEVTTPDTVNLDAADAENRAVKFEVLQRIDVMPSLSDEERDKLYVQVERAQAMGKLITVPFGSGARVPDAKARAAVVEAVRKPQIERFSGDPTVVFVVLGFADTKGRPEANQAISLARAEAVAKILKEQAGVMNVVHAVGMGGSELFDSGRLEKNRVVEVWAVLP